VCTACMTRDSSGRLYLLDASLPLPFERLCLCVCFSFHGQTATRYR